MNFEIGEILAKAWKITWKHKVLWLFGILASISQVVNFGNNGIRVLTQKNVLPPELFGQLGALFRNGTFWVIFIVSICLLLVVLLFLSTIGQIGIIKGVSMADRSDEPFTFGQVFNASKSSFWRLFAVSLVTGFFFFFVFLILFGLLLGGIFLAILPARATGSTGQIGDILAVGVVCLIPLLCLILLLITVLSPILAESMIAIVVDDLGIRAGIAKGWQVVRSHVGPIILIVVLNYIVATVAGFVIAIPGLAAVLPLLMLLPGMGSSATLVYLTLACLCVAIPFVLLVQSVFTVFVQAIWTLTYIRLTAPTPAVPAAAIESADAA